MKRMLENHLEMIRRAAQELDRCKPNTPHRRDVYKRLRRLKAEYREAVGYLNDSKRVS